MTSLRQGVLLAAAAWLVFMFVGRARGSDGAPRPDYMGTGQYTKPYTREKVAKWAKPALIYEGFWDPVTGNMTQKYYSLPREGSTTTSRRKSSGFRRKKSSWY